MTALLSGVTGAAQFLIWSQNEPLIGPVHVGTGAFAHAVEQFRVIDLGHSAAAH